MLRSLAEDQTTLAIGNYIHRARQERELAARASTTQAAHAHLKLAQRYEALVTLVENTHEEASPACFPFESRSASRSLFGSPSHY